jgi:hypothetical protein
VLAAEEFMTFVNFFAAWARVQWFKFRGYDVLVSVEINQARSEVCHGCRWNRNEECVLCGCLIMSKTLLASEECPKKLWKRLRIKKSDSSSS